MAPAEKLELITTIMPVIAIIVSVTMAAWVITTWMRIKHGYPLESSWGKAIYPQKNEELLERVKLISSENAQLRAELGSVKDRLATVERIVTDEGSRLAREIDGLAITRN